MITHEAAKAFFVAMTDEQRDEVFTQYTKICGAFSNVRDAFAQAIEDVAIAFIETFPIETLIYIEGAE